MIKTILFTKAFKQNLSKFSKVEVLETKLPTSEVVEEVKVVQREEAVQPPKFKEFESEVVYERRQKKEWGKVEYEPVLRELRIRPDLSAEIQEAKLGVDGEKEKLARMMSEENQRFCRVKEQQERLARFIQQTDVRNKG